MRNYWLKQKNWIKPISKQLRFLQGRPIVPLGYVQPKNAQHKRKAVNKYTAEGRKQIHQNTESANNIEETVSSNTDNERSAEEIKRKNRIPFYPKEWKDSFGLPVEEHRKALEINMLDGYAEFTTGK